MRFLQPIVYRGQLVACASRDRVFLSGALQHRHAHDPELRFVLLMCCYAREVLSGWLPGFYDVEDARRYAQAALIPEELLERPSVDIRRAALGLGVPVDELEAARQRWSRRHGSHEHA